MLELVSNASHYKGDLIYFTYLHGKNTVDERGSGEHVVEWTGMRNSWQ